MVPFATRESEHFGKRSDASAVWQWVLPGVVKKRREQILWALQPGNLQRISVFSQLATTSQHHYIRVCSEKKKMVDHGRLSA